ncbi:MAG: translation elongation factor Ts [Lachnospiraceae bacterium]|nr:translation elongation factor Ts [Lachnospiraceae bacterium]
MAVTASMVKELREISGAGMMDCKKALTECDGDMQAAVDALRKSGAAKAEKKASRIAAEGITRAAISADSKTGVVVEVNSETDFVAKNEVFQTFVQEIADQALTSALVGGDNCEEVDALLEENGLKDALIEKTATIGEKLSFRRFQKVTGDVVVSYLHGGGRIGVLVAGDGTNDDGVKEALTNVAMQIAAMNPQYISRADISADEIAKLREITIDSALNDSFSLPKPILQGLLDKAVNDKVWSDEDIAIYEEKKSNMNYLPNFLSNEAKTALAELAMADKETIIDNKIFNGLVEGRISKQVKEISLMDQTYVKAEDGKQTVAKYLESVNKELKIAKFVRFEVGEGMEKKNEDFAAEVAAQMNA